ncbi:hypothetical protein J1N35_012155 [Gossypium stocksii]|uniref:Uncharacterized protein n=1 Tax=Gossypium stocksii TaxID=47602 RepID=A0A9D4AC48_9ROSI|nr:hypothetical protein J1N35_012155 [Gossypium stocksii]
MLAQAKTKKEYKKLMAEMLRSIDSESEDEKSSASSSKTMDLADDTTSIRPGLINSGRPKSKSKPKRWFVVRLSSAKLRVGGVSGESGFEFASSSSSLPLVFTALLSTTSAKVLF